jgi:Fic/DOC family
VAGRLAGAFRNIGRAKIADDIVASMRAAGYVIQESDPFQDAPAITFDSRETSPYVNRMRMMWAAMRGPALENFPAPPGLPRNKRDYLRDIDGLYVSDAYNSLSIEGYRVSTQLIDRVRSGNWDPDNDENDRDNRNALAARGYWQAFQTVKLSVEKVLNRANPGKTADDDHGSWYRELFGPSVTAGILNAADLAGYRNGAVYIRRSMHVPPSNEAVRDLMPAFFELLSAEPEPAVRVVLGHFVFVYIHPYLDGNGRMGRFLMNVMLASGGYPWTIVPLERRDTYVAALESASVKQDIRPFTRFLSDLVRSPP